MPVGVYCFKLISHEKTSSEQKHFIKIGRSNNVARRMCEYKTSSLWGRFVVDEVEIITPLLWRRSAAEASSLRVDEPFSRETPVPAAPPQASSLRVDEPFSQETPVPAAPPQADSNASSQPMSPDLDAGRVHEPYSPATTIPGCPTPTKETSHIIDITNAEHEWEAHLRENAQGQKAPHRSKQAISTSSTVKASNASKQTHAFNSDSVKEASRLQFRRILDQGLRSTMGTAYEESISTSNYGFREVPLRQKHPRVPV
jgi:hypothetical protein